MSASSPRRTAPHIALVPPSQAGGEAQSVADVALIAALRDGDPRVAAAFHDRVRPGIDRTLLRVLGRRDMDHDDLAQRALIELFTTIQSYRGECALDSWVATLTARVVFKHLRRRRLERRLFDAIDAEDEVVLAAPGEVGAQATMRGLIRRIGALLETLDRDRAWAYLLHDVCGYDLREIADITGASVAAAQSRLSRGRRELHALLARDPELRELLETGRGARG